MGVFSESLHPRGAGGKFAGSRFGGQRVQRVARKAKPRKPLPSSAAHRRVIAESVHRDNGRVVYDDLAHGRTKLRASGRGGYAYRGAGPLSGARAARARALFRT